MRRRSVNNYFASASGHKLIVDTPPQSAWFQPTVGNDTPPTTLSGVNMILDILQSLPPVITATAALITAIAGLIKVLRDK